MTREGEQEQRDGDVGESGAQQAALRAVGVAGPSGTDPAGHRLRRRQQSDRTLEFGEHRVKYRAEVGGRQARRQPQRGMALLQLGDLARRVVSLRCYLHDASYLGTELHAN